MKELIGAIIDGKSSSELIGFYYRIHRPANVFTDDLVYSINPESLESTTPIFLHNIVIVEMPGKSTLKHYIKYLIMYWLIREVLKTDSKEFNGIDLIRFVKKMVDKPEMYHSTTTKYLNELANNEMSIGYHCVNRQKSIYCLDWFSQVQFDNYYN